MIFDLVLSEKPSSSSELNPCLPSPCGPNSQCKSLNGQAVCSCLENYQGTPPNCRPECLLSTECPAERACIQQRCQDPCPGTCGTNAECFVRNHSPICRCLNGFTGDAFTRCYPLISSKNPYKSQYFPKWIESNTFYI